MTEDLIELITGAKAETFRVDSPHVGQVLGISRQWELRQVAVTEAPDAGRPEHGRPRTPPEGLTGAEVRERRNRGQVNAIPERTSRTVGEIVRANILTRFNAILGFLLVVILVVGPIQDALFGVVLVSNALIGIVQELRAKRTLDQLVLLSATGARVVRDGTLIEVPIGEIVLDDLVEVRAGDQVVADGEVMATTGLEVDESLLTGESDPVLKEAGDEVLSGSFVVAGRGRFQATRVGEASYARGLAAEARRFTLVHSELQAGIDRILRSITFAMVPIGVLLLISQLRTHTSVRHSLAGTVAGLVAIVPEGLVLLTSVAFAVSVVTLGRQRVLVQELPAVEGLARVDVMCLDKTGTLTEGQVSFSHVEPLPGVSGPEQALGALAGGSERNATLAAIAAALPAPVGWPVQATVAFSSARRWSGARFEGRGTWVLGAADLLLEGIPGSDQLRARVGALAGEGSRVLLLARTDHPLEGERLPPGLVPAAVVVLEERVRTDAAETVRYFLQQGVDVKIVSGDDPVTVAAIAVRAGVPGAERPVDGRGLPPDPTELAALVKERSVFGRVDPHDKRRLVLALQRAGRVVAMTGDGVNDMLALKEADIGVAMGSATPATKAVAQLVLLDGRFAAMPHVVAEGRRVIANIERVANLFVTKTVYAALLALAIGVAHWPFPFLPRHLTLVGSLTIGIPAFFLSLAPNRRRYHPGFVRRVLLFALPAGTVAAVATMGSYGLARAERVPLDEARTTAALVLMAVGLWILGILARPMTGWRRLLLGAMGGGLTLVLTVPGARHFFALDLPAWPVAIQAGSIAGIALLCLEAGWHLSRWLVSRTTAQRDSSTIRRWA